MLETTLCYLIYDNHYLMLHRNKKEADLNKGKWIGVGGKIEANETIEQCLIREVQEETGIALKTFTKRGIIDFHQEGADERMHLFTATVSTPSFQECSEGTLRWIPIDEVLSLNLWEGDRIFLKKLMDGESDFTLDLYYEGDRLVIYNCSYNLS